MFTVKATYRGETRRFSFSDDQFPSYEQLQSQISKVFCIGTGFYMSKLVFAQDSNVPDRRVLVGNKVHNAEEYEDHIRVYLRRSWPGALLKFTVVDDSTASNSSIVQDDTTVAETASVAPGGGDVHLEAPTELVYDSDAHSQSEASEGYSRSDTQRRIILDRIRQGTSSRTSTTSNTAVVDDTNSDSETETEAAPVRRTPFEGPSRSVTQRASFADMLSTLRPLPQPPTTSSSGEVRPKPSLPNLQEHLRRIHDRSEVLKHTAESLRRYSAALGSGSSCTPRLESEPSPIQRSSTRFEDAEDNRLPQSIDRAIRPLWQGSKQSSQSPSSHGTNASTPVPQTFTLQGRSAPERSFDEASQRTVDIGLELLQTAERLSSNVYTNPATQGTDSSSDSEEDTTSSRTPRDPVLNRLEPSPLDHSRRANILARLNARRPPATLQSRPVSLYSTSSSVTAVVPPLNRVPSPPPRVYVCPPTVLSRSSSPVSRRTLSPHREFMEYSDSSSSTLSSPAPIWRPLPPQTTMPVPPPPILYPSTSTPLNSCGTPIMPANFPGVTAAAHACGWAAECDKLKKQMGDVQDALRTLRTDFDEAMSRNATATAGVSSATLDPAPFEPYAPFYRASVAVTDRLPSSGVYHTVPPPSVSSALPSNSGGIGYSPAYLTPPRAAADSATVGKASHPGITCDGCNQPVSGIRHKCLDCDDFDFCDTCVGDPVLRNMHDAKHSFFPIDIPGDRSTYDAVRSRRGAVHPGITCDGCRKRVVGVRHKCLECDDFDYCDKCISTTAVRSRHDLGHRFFPIETPEDRRDFIRAREYSSTSRHASVEHPAVCDGCNSRLIGVRHKCLVCDDFDFCNTCIADPEKRASHTSSHAFFPIIRPHDRTAYQAARAQVNSPSTEPVIHTNVACNKCDDIIIGVRHKCLDCPDFDLCGECVDRGARRDHNGFHQFLEIAKPGDVIIHTVRMPETPAPPRPQPARPVEPVMHNATCNLCDSRIRGLRYKCLNCPNFDTCEACFSITTEHHPGHGFVKIEKLDQLLLRDTLRSSVAHPAACNECGQSIRGTRYKCLHSDCPDYDLCQNCEALPIPVHPLSHPLIRLKVPETEVPRVRVPEPSAIAPLPSPPFPHYQPLAMEPTEPSMTDLRSPRPSFMPIPSPEPVIPGHFVPQVREQECRPHRESSVIPAVPRLIPACWTPPEIDWRWNMTPPGPMVVPNMLSEEVTPLMDRSLFQYSPERLNPLVHPSAPELTGFAEVIGSATPPPMQSTPIQYSPTPLPISPPPRPLIDLEEHAVPSRGASTPNVNASTGLTTPSNGDESPVALIQPPPRLDAVGDQEWRELWPELTTILRHLLQPTTPPTTTNDAPPMPSIAVAQAVAPAAEIQETVPPSAQESQTAGDKSPAPVDVLPSVATEMVERSRDFGRNLFEYMNGVIPPLPAPLPVRHQAAYVSDNNIQDGQMFPPGAEFVKSWVMRNDGETAWPEETTLRYVAGDRMAPREGATMHIPVGAVLPGADVELVGGEMKAPELPGKYVSYWRLHDGEQFFGSSIWVDIVVAELTRPESSAEESLAASSVIMPPAPSVGADTLVSNAFSNAASAAPSLQPTTVTIPSSPASDDGSFDSSISLVDVPSSPSIQSEDEDIFQDSRSRVAPSPAVETNQDVEYVVLYDTTSSEEDN